VSAKEARAKWLAKHPDYHRRYYLAHRDETLATARAKAAHSYSQKHLSMLARKEAIARGDKFFVGTPCLYGHDGTRYVSSKTCVECGSAHMKARNADRENANKIVMDWRRRNPHANTNQKAKRRGASGRHDKNDLVRIREFQNDCCGQCRRNLEGSGQLDHIMPIALGGSNWPSNLQWLCAPCNRAKHDQDPREYARKTGLMPLAWAALGA
jgi:5-methylcytosine-specific restriction endonuclease McrA